MIEKYIKEASRFLPVFWPLQGFIATNPLWDLHDEPFCSMLAKLSRVSPVAGVMPINFYQKLYRHGKILDDDLCFAIKEYIAEGAGVIPGLPSHPCDEKIKYIKNLLLSSQISSDDNLANSKKIFLISEKIMLDFVANASVIIKQEVLAFLMLYFDRGQSSVVFSRENGMFHAWSEFLSCNNKKLYSLVAELPSSKLDAINHVFSDLGILSENKTDYLTGIYFQLLGWSSLVKWVEQRPDNPFVRVSASLSDIALIWLCYENYYYHRNKCNFSFENLNHSNDNFNFDSIDIGFIWQRAYELSYERELDVKLENNSKIQKTKKLVKPSFQAIFCIDTRSEGIRRYLESVSSYETYGYAGFFGFVFNYQSSHQLCDTLQCPALFPPEVFLRSEARSSWFDDKYINFYNSLSETKKSLLTSFVFVEITGMWYAIIMLLKSFFPQFFGKIKKYFFNSRQKNINNTTITANQVNESFGFECRVNNSVQFLKTIGLTEFFSPLILICGHGAETENNPYQASFDCGACGGNAGYANAIVACHVLNDPRVRDALKLQNIAIPSTTHFIAGFHNTTRDEVILYEKNIPSYHDDALHKLKHDLEKSLRLLRQERKKDLPGKSNVNNRSVHWAELMPEMGLLNNAALIIGPRKLTENISLERRVFLQSYDPINDPDGKLLTGILLGPLVVAHWINAQYYFSTTDPEVCGSGNKMLHNVVSGLGVMEGNLSDLKIGLPWQSVAFRNDILHQPLRLLVVIYAPRLLVESILSQHPSIQNLFSGQWVHLKIIEPPKNASSI